MATNTHPVAAKYYEMSTGEGMPEDLLITSGELDVALITLSTCRVM